MDREDFKQRSDQLTDLDKSRLICGVLFSVAAFCMRTGVAIGSYTLTFGIILESWFLSAVYGAIFWLLLSGGLFDRGFIRRFGRLTPLVPFLTIFTIIVVVFSFFFFTSDSKERAIESAVEQAYEDAYQEHYKVIFNEGYEKGFDEGQADGYDVGHYEAIPKAITKATTTATQNVRKTVSGTNIPRTILTVFIGSAMRTPVRISARKVPLPIK